VVLVVPAVIVTVVGHHKEIVAVVQRVGMVVVAELARMMEVSLGSSAPEVANSCPVSGSRIVAEDY
jgi:hypothetical protein